VLTAPNKYRCPPCLCEPLAWCSWTGWRWPQRRRWRTSQISLSAVCSVSHWRYVVVRSSLRIRPRSRREILEDHWPSSRAAVDMVQPSVVRICRKSVLSGLFGIGDLAVDFPCRVAFEATHDFPFAFAFGGAFGHVFLSPLARGHADQDDLIQGMVCVAVTARPPNRYSTAGPRRFRKPKTVPLNALGLLVLARRSVYGDCTAYVCARHEPPGP
jgi:hypothetical protein